MATHNYKCMVVGDAVCGKTTFVGRLVSGEYRRDYHPTLGVEVTPLSFQTSVAIPIKFSVWDMAGCEEYVGDNQNRLIYHADCAILVYDVTRPITYDHLEMWYNLVVGSSGRPNIPIVVCGNKCDQGDHDSHLVGATFHGLSVHYISARSNYKIESPFLELARTLMGNPNLEFAEEMLSVPAEVILDEN